MMNNTTPTLEEMKAIARETLRLNIEMIPSDAALKEVYQSVDQLIEATYATAKCEALREVREYADKKRIKELPSSLQDPGGFCKGLGRNQLVTELVTYLESELNSGAESK